MRFDWQSLPTRLDLGTLARTLDRRMKALQSLFAGLTRTESGDLRHEGRVIAGGGLGIGNHIAATTPGTITGAVEVFDADGNSLGYVAVYDSIS